MRRRASNPVLLGLAAMVLCGCQVAPAQPLPAGPAESEVGPYRAQHWWIPVPQSPASDSMLSLEAMVYRPPGDGPFPLVTINHGVPVDKSHIAETKPGFVRAAHWFVDRGFAVVVPLRRGFGRSQGDYDVTHGCSAEIYVERATETARDEAAVVRFMARQPFVDARRLLVVGQSAGGFGAVALGDDPPPGVVAVISFAGGMGGDDHEHICGGEDALIDAAGRLGRRNKVPELWLFAENDHFFNPPLAAAMFQSFSENSRPAAEFVRLPAFGEDGHKTLAQAPTANWEGPVAAFIGKVLPQAVPTAAAASLPK